MDEALHGTSSPGPSALWPPALGLSAPGPSAVIVIPARYGSTRLPGKALQDLEGFPMVEHVRRRALAVRGVQAVLVATDDVRIADQVRGYGGEAVMTSSHHLSGSDRVWEVLAARPEPLVVNVQGDEPLLDPGAIEALLGAFVGSDVQVATLAAPGEGDGAQPSVVKVDLDPHSGLARDFFRDPPRTRPWLRHIGVYAYRREALAAFCARSPGPRERAERLEQLRFLEYGVPVAVVSVPRAWPSVDTPEDLEEVRALMRALRTSKA